MTKTPQTLGARIRARREALGLSQTALADAVPMNASALCDLEHEANPTVGINSRRLSALADALDCTTDALLGRTPPRTRQDRRTPSRGGRTRAKRPA